MNRNYLRNLICLSLGLVAMSTTMAIHAKEQEDPDNLPQRREYHLRQTNTPLEFKKWDTALFYDGGMGVYTTSGAAIVEGNEKVKDFAINPSGANMLLVTEGKKEPKFVLYKLNEENKPVFTFKTKNFGQASSATYSADAREIYMANTDKKLVRMDARTLLPKDTILLSFVPTRMVTSNNGYFLAVSDGTNVDIYNLETGKKRTGWDFESKVSDMAFDKDSKEFAVLTDDGLLSIYDTRNFIIKKELDDLGDAVAVDYNPDGKYVAVASADGNIKIVNLLKANDVMEINTDTPLVTDLIFYHDSNDIPLLAYATPGMLHVERMYKLAPYYGKLVKDEADAMMTEWLKMMPGESIEDYQLRVNDDARRHQMRLFEAEAASAMASDLLSMSTVSLGAYDRTNQVLEVNFDNMPSIYLPVAETNIGAFTDAADLEFINSKYGVMNDDDFELIYAEIRNMKDGNTYVYNNIDRAELNYMKDDDNTISVEVLQQQQMEAMKLEELKEKVVEEARQRNVITNHTDIAVNSEVKPDYNADGEKVLNYLVKVSYTVDPAFTVHEDFAPGKYHAEQSPAAGAMLKIVKDAFEGDFAQYLRPDKKVIITISGTADATPIRSSLAYDGTYGDFVDEPVMQDGSMKALTLTKKAGITTNEQLAFARAVGVKDFIEKNIENLSNMNTDYRYNIHVSEDRGSQHRRISVEFLFVDAL